MDKQSSIINKFKENLSKATLVINSNTTRPYHIEICKNVIGRYDNLVNLYNDLECIISVKDIEKIIKLFAILCLNFINLIYAIKMDNINMKEQIVLKINVIQEHISDLVD
tara:strand:+ start:578 stop:907 length:330 start_codon:yes stop_codon:yes gene_type:complete